MDTSYINIIHLSQISFYIQVYFKMLILYNVMLFVVSFFSVFISGIYIYWNTMNLVKIKCRIISEIFMWQELIMLYCILLLLTCVLLLWNFHVIRIDYAVLYSNIADVCIIVIIYNVERTFVSWYNLCPIQLLKCLAIKYV